MVLLFIQRSVVMVYFLFRNLSLRFLYLLHVCVLAHQVVCVGSMAELEELSGVKVTDLHRER